MKHNYSDLAVSANSNNIPATISIYRGDSANSYQEALEDGATYHIDKLENIFDIKVEHFNLANSLTIADLFGNDSMMFAVHDDTQLFFELEATELTYEFVESYRLGLIKHLTNTNTNEYTVNGWNYENGCGVNVQMEFPMEMTVKDMYNEASERFRAIAEERCGNGDNLWVVSIIEGTPVYIVDADFCNFYDKYGFDKAEKKIFNYSLSTNTIWFGGDNGQVEADTYEEAMVIAQDEVRKHLDKINKLIGKIDIIEVDLSAIKLEEAK
jgi:hypothetical protein